MDNAKLFGYFEGLHVIQLVLQCMLSSWYCSACFISVTRMSLIGNPWPSELLLSTSEEMTPALGKHFY